MPNTSRARRGGDGQSRAEREREPRDRDRSERERDHRGDGSGSAGGSALGVALDFMRLLWAVDHGLQRRSKRMETELGVTGMQRVVIRLIGRYPEIAAGRLAELVHVHPSTLTGVLRRLVDRGFIQRDRDAEDARRSKFVLLPPGTSIDSTQAGTVEAAVRRALSRLPPETIDSARTVLAAVAEELARVDR